MLKLEKSYFTLAEIQARWGVPSADIQYFIVNEHVSVCVWVFGIEAMNVEGPEPTMLNGLHALHGEDAWAVLRTGASAVKRFCVNGVELRRIELLPPFIVREDDLMITREERDRFERQCGFSAGDERSPDSFEPLDTFQHDATYANVTIGSDRFRLGALQASVVRQLHIAAQTDQPWVHQSILTAKARAGSDRVVDLFASKEKLNAIIDRDGHGNCRLNLPKKPSRALCRSAYSLASDRGVGSPSHPSPSASHV